MHLKVKILSISVTFVFVEMRSKSSFQLEVKRDIAYSLFSHHGNPGNS